jgi:hypothetical protein
MNSEPVEHHAIVSVTGVTKGHGRRAVIHLRRRSLIAFYNDADKSLNAFEFKEGKDWTDRVLRMALAATCR